jgi:hypothetical protein
MKKIQLVIALSLFSTFILAQEEKKKSTVNHDFELELEAEYRYFTDDKKFDGQESHFPSLAIKPSYNLEWNKGRESLNFTGFFRLDRDKERTHFDIRELYYQHAKGKSELSIGLKKIYWGVTESNHLVDIINQTDQVESFDGEKKLGQPMVHYSYYTNIGTFDLFYLPYFRKRTFAGEKSRLRFPVVIDEDDIGFESSAEEWHQDVALRWSHSFSIVDLGLSHFYGNGREPLFNFDQNGNISAFYPIINQTGVDLQLTHNAFLWKVESIYRSSDTQDMFALAAGFEFTISNVKNSGIDVSLLSEYLYDDRDEWAFTGMQNDLFLGSRIAFNDVKSTEILLGTINDLEKNTSIFSIEASQRLGNSAKIELEGRLFNKVSENELLLSNFENDSFFRVSLFKYF